MSARDYIVDLLDSRRCTGSCLLGRDGESCTCRCGGEHHGKALDTLEARGDGLIGRYFVEMKECPRCLQFPNRSGRITAIVAPGVYLRRYFSALTGGAMWGETLVRLDEMTAFTFYESMDEMNDAWEYGGLGSALDRHARSCVREDIEEGVE